MRTATAPHQNPTREECVRYGHEARNYFYRWVVYPIGILGGNILINNGYQVKIWSG